MTDGMFVDFDCMYAAEKEPLLKGHPGNARRRAALDRIRNLLESSGGEGRSGLLEFVGSMEPDSALRAWERMYHRIREVDQSVASLAALEYRVARTDAWKAMKTGADVIPHLRPICADFDGRLHDALGDMRSELCNTLASLDRSVSLGDKMRDHVVNLARFGSRVDDGMTLLLVDELYIRRGLLEEACEICEKMLEFEGFDFHRMAASTLVEGIVLKILAALEERGKKDRDLARACGGILQRRSEGLGLGISHDRGDNLLRTLSEFASDISYRRRICPAGELGEHIKRHHPDSFRFLELDRASNLEGMVEKKSMLAAHISVSIDSQRIAAARGVPYALGNALTVLEPMLGMLDSLEGKPPLKKWKGGMRGMQLWSCLFEMEMYLRLRLACPDTSVALDRKVCGKVVDLEIDGCYAETYSPRDGELLVPNHWMPAGASGRDVMRQVLAKRQLESVGDHGTAMIIECPPSMYMRVAGPGKDAMELLAQSKQPGAVFFVSGTRSARREHAILENSGAIAPVPEPVIGAIRKALDLEFPPRGTQGAATAAG